MGPGSRRRTEIIEISDGNANSGEGIQALASDPQRFTQTVRSAPWRAGGCCSVQRCAWGSAGQGAVGLAMALSKQSLQLSGQEERFPGAGGDK